MAKRSPTVTYLCQLCGKKCTGMVDSTLAMLSLCDGCQSERYAKGQAARRLAEKQEAARAAG